MSRLRTILPSLLVLAAILAGLFVVVGIRPASACSCAALTDDGYLDLADVVFRGELVGYEVEDDPDGDGEYASSDPAFWTFAVDEVYRGTVDSTTVVASPRDGASCGLEIPRTGTFVVFANITTDDDGYGFEPGGLAANLCGGTRAADAPLEFSVELEPRPPDDAPEPIPEAVGGTDDDAGDGTAAESGDDGDSDTAADDETADGEEPVPDASGGELVLLIGFIIVGIGGAWIAARLARRSRHD